MERIPHDADGLIRAATEQSLTYAGIIRRDPMQDSKGRWYMRWDYYCNICGDLVQWREFWCDEDGKAFRGRKGMKREDPNGQVKRSGDVYCHKHRQP